MKLHLSRVRLNLLFCLAALRLISAADLAPTESIADLHCDAVTMTHVDTDSVQIAMTLSGTAKKSLTLETISFQHVTVNGMPLRLSPVRGPFRLVKAQPITDLPLLSGVSNFAEIPSLEPLRDILAGGNVHIHADLLARIDLNPVEMLVLRSKTVWVMAHIDQDVKTHFAAGTLGQLAAAAAFAAAEPAWRMANRARELRDGVAAFEEEARQALSNSLVDIRTTFAIRRPAGETQTVETASLGLILPSGRILTVNEAVEPWIYSPALAQALSRGEASLDESSFNIAVRPAKQPGSPWLSSRKGAVQVSKRHPKTVPMLADSAKSKYGLARRDSPDNLAVLEVPGLNPPEPASTLTRLPGLDDWNKAAVFQFDPSGRLNVSFTKVRRSNGRLALRDAEPGSAGSPIWLESGVTGILQDEDSGTPSDAITPLFSFGFSNSAAVKDACYRAVSLITTRKVSP